MNEDEKLKVDSSDNDTIDEKRDLVISKEKDILNTKVDEFNNNLIEEIVEETRVDRLKDLTHLFNVNLAKKNMLRLLKLNGLMDMVNDEILTRLQDASDIDDKDLVKFVQVIQMQMDKSLDSINSIDATSTIQINQQNNNIDINVEKGNPLDRESREKVIDVISKILNVSNDKGSNSSYDNVIDVIDDDENI